MKARSATLSLSLSRSESSTCRFAFTGRNTIGTKQVVTLALQFADCAANGEWIVSLEERDANGVTRRSSFVKSFKESQHKRALKYATVYAAARGYALVT